MFILDIKEQFRAIVQVFSIIGKPISSKKKISYIKNDQKDFVYYQIKYVILTIKKNLISENINFGSPPPGPPTI